jgi:YegS/Rv2252/BmrU family lipid kinase
MPPRGADRMTLSAAAMERSRLPGILLCPHRSIPMPRQLAQAVSPHSLDRKAELERMLQAERRAVLVVNTHSRRGRQLYGRAKRLLGERGCRLEAAYPVHDPSRTPEIVAGAVAQGHRFIIVGGGDGTISSIVDALAHRDVVLGILPLGTANSFARTVGIPLVLEDAIDVLLNGKVADVDLGQINDDRFANAAAIGLPAKIARTVPPALKRWFGRVAYLITAIVQLIRHRPFRCTLSQPEGTRVFDALEVRVANGAYQGGVLVADEAHLESHDIVIHVIKGPSKLNLVRTWIRALLGRAPNPEEVEIVRCRDISIETDPQQYVSIDGEAVTQTPVRAAVDRQALLLMVPGDRQDLR